MSTSNLIGVLTQIRRGIIRNAYPNETAVRTQVVQRILHELGWAVFDPDKVCNEFSLKLGTKTRRIDLALCIFKGKPRCIIELKSTNYDLKQVGRSDGDKQLFEYAFHAGAPLALLTNGVVWRFYSTFSAGTYDERLVRAVDIQAEPPDDVAAALGRYISYANTESGKSAHYAVEDLQERVNRQKAREAIPRAWMHLVDKDPDERLVALLTDATSMVSESAPGKRDVVAFLGTLRPADSPRQRRVAQSPAAPPKKPTANVSKSTSAVGKHTVPVRQHAAVQPVAGGGLRYVLLGQERIAKNAKSAYVAIFESLAERDPDLLARVEPTIRGHKNRGVARKQHELAANESMVESAVAIGNGWWLLTKISNAKKISRLKSACAAAGIPFGDRSGLLIDLPNA